MSQQLDRSTGTRPFSSRLELTPKHGEACSITWLWSEVVDSSQDDGLLTDADRHLDVYA